MSLGSPRLQIYWDWRAANNWVGGGSGSGIMVAAAVFTLVGIDSYNFSILSLVFVSAGLFSVLMKIGHPLRVLNVYRNPFTSWMSREAWAAFLVFPFGAAACWFKSEVLLLLAAASAAAYMYCQAMIMKASRAIPAWRVAQIVPFIMVSGLIEGVALVLIAGLPFASMYEQEALSGVLLMVIFLLIFRLLSWRKYYSVLENNAPEGTVEVLEKSNLPFLVFGDLLPAVFILLAILLDKYVAFLMVLASLLMLAAGWAIKYVIVTKAAYYQGYAVPHSPARGAGEPSIGIKPGWVQKK